MESTPWYKKFCRAKTVKGFCTRRVSYGHPNEDVCDDHWQQKYGHRFITPNPVWREDEQTWYCAAQTCEICGASTFGVQRACTAPLKPDLELHTAEAVEAAETVRVEARRKKKRAETDYWAARAKIAEAQLEARFYE